MTETKWTSFDGSERELLVWDEGLGDTEIKGVVQIIHGMAEYAERYDDFAGFLNKNGYVAAALQDRAHKGALIRGYETGDIFEDTIRDNLFLTAYLASKYDAPVSVLGHSYGSMIAQGYIQNAPAIKSVILSGSAARTDVLSKIGYLVAKIQKFFLGGKKTAKLIGKLSFGAFDKPYKSENQKYAWLSRDNAVSKAYDDDPLCGYDMSINFQVSFLGALQRLPKDENVEKVSKELPIMIISGDDDPVGGNGKFVEELYGIYLKNGLKKIKFKLYKGARHEILNETNKEEVYGDVLDFINTVS
ncbi:MAG: alpha/beta hydrolase [Clostridiales bacterium]|jgi:alpha-beta hydrolase superfamily lysophospholipase|nr:alpha/beta hydrolase [Clostridiales bacterium]